MTACKTMVSLIEQFHPVNMKSVCFYEVNANGVYKKKLCRIFVSINALRLFRLYPPEWWNLGWWIFFLVCTHTYTYNSFQFYRMTNATHTYTNWESIKKLNQIHEKKKQPSDWTSLGQLSFIHFPFEFEFSFFQPISAFY